MQRWIYETTPDDLAAWLAAQGAERFRTQQVLDWVYKHNARSFEEMTNLPQRLRQALAAAYRVGPLAPAGTSEGRDTVKLLLDMPGGGQIECVRIRMGSSDTACLSSQVGCSVRCAFCATGQMGCERSLTAAEMILQLVSLRALSADGVVQADRRVGNVVFMGMGEPLLNYANLVRAIRLLTDRRTFGISPGRITVSTAGIVPMIRKYATEGLATELTISLNAPNDELRRRLMPGVARWPVKDIIAACREFSAATGGQPVTYAYVLIEGVNDLLDHTTELARLLRHERHHLNLIPLNPVPHYPHRAPDKQRANAFLHHCRKAGLNVSLRHSKGAEVDAACGQLRTRIARKASPRTK